jgi:hypothetical protein
MSIAERASAKVGDVYPIIVTGKPHHLTRKKQRIAWQLGYIKGYEEARREQLHKHMRDNVSDKDEEDDKKDKGA